MKSIKIILLTILFSVFFYGLSFAAVNLDFKKSQDDSFVPIQEKYESLKENIPAYIMIKATGTSVISSDVIDAIQDKLNRAMIETEKMKPVLLDKWLFDKYSAGKEKNIYDFINALSIEKFKDCNVAGLCHPYVFKTSDGFVLMISFYRYSDKGYPVTTFRQIKSLSECSKAFRSMLNEFLKIEESKSDQLYGKKKVVIKPFNLESRKYLGQTSGEFDYIPSTFIEQDGIIIRSSDDTFSRMLGYSLYSTQMVQVINAQDLDAYVEPNFNKYDFADYYIEGRIQLTDQINIYHITLFDAKTRQPIQNVKYFSSDFSILGMNIANNNIVYSLADSIFGKGNYGVSPDISVPGQGMFLNNIYVGWDNLSKFILPKGKHIIYTGDYFNPDTNYEVKNKNKSKDINGNIYRSFFLYLDERNWLFRGNDGERVWNLLGK